MGLRSAALAQWSRARRTGLPVLHRQALPRCAHRHARRRHHARAGRRTYESQIIDKLHRGTRIKLRLGQTPSRAPSRLQREIARRGPNLHAERTPDERWQAAISHSTSSTRPSGASQLPALPSKYSSSQTRLVLPAVPYARTASRVRIGRSVRCQTSQIQQRAGSRFRNSSAKKQRHVSDRYRQHALFWWAL